MSSPTKPQPCEAILRKHGQPTGPVRLPMVDRDFFIDAFNRQYHGTGMTLTGIERPSAAGATDGDPTAGVP